MVYALSLCTLLTFSSILSCAREAGFAHYLEHMLFLGTSKYPAEQDFQRHISDHGGSLNAFTASDHTMYYFSIDPEALEGGLDRLAQFFISPLFSESASDREKNAVEEEYRKNLDSDGWRRFQVVKELADQRHPFSFFNHVSYCPRPGL
jgi:insulysin